MRHSFTTNHCGLPGLMLAAVPIITGKVETHTDDHETQNEGKD
jgi:hypothetical protein